LMHKLLAQEVFTDCTWESALPMPVVELPALARMAIPRARDVDLH